MKFMLNPRQEVARNDVVEQLDRELTRMAIAQYETPEFKLLFSTPLTLQRARVNAILTVHYGINRRDCWAYVQARCPYNVKKTIWEHEKDELSFDPRGGADHRTLQLKEAMALDLTEEDVKWIRIASADCFGILWMVAHRCHVSMARCIDGVPCARKAQQ